jgi:pilus assembly protein FimV
MNNRTRLRASLIAAVLAAVPVGAYAAGMGNLTVLSPLGQQLQAELNISATPEELASLSVRLASLETFRQAGVEYVPTLSTLRFSIEKRANGQPYVRVTSSQSVNEPFLDILVELNWSQGRLVREYTFLLDPPEALQKAPVAAVAAPEVNAAPVVAAPPAPPSPTQQVVTTPPAPTPEKKIPGERVSKAAPTAKPPAEAKPVATPAPATKSGDRVVKSGDTLSKIAVETRPEGASLDQMLLALFNSNKAAFDADNMHRLRAGKILAIPDAQTVAAIDKGEARKTVSAQAADFNAYRQKLAAVAVAKPAKKEEAPQQAAVGKIAPKVEDKVPAPVGKDKLQVSRAEATKDAKPGATGNRGGVSEEDLVAKEKSLKEAKSRITELEKNVGEMKKLAELKSQNLADLQKQAQVTGKPAPAPTPTLVPAPAPAPVAKPAPLPLPAAAPVEVAKAAEPAKPAETVADKPVEAAKPAVPAEKKPLPIADKPKPAVVPVPPEAPDFIDENPELVYGGGGIVALLLGYLGYSAMRRKRQGTESVAPSQASEEGLTANSVFGTTGGRSVDTSNSSIQTDFSQSGMGSIDTDEGVDPVAEADVYMAYGRDAQAEEILVDALKTDPNRLAIHLKLLEIYAGRRSVQQFETLAGEVFARTTGTGPEWDKAATLGRSIDPDNPLYAVKGSIDSSAVEAVTEHPALAKVSPVADAAVLQDPLADKSEVGQTPRQPETPPEALSDALDFDLDLGANTEPGDEIEWPTLSDVDIDLGTEIVAQSAIKLASDDNLLLPPSFEGTQSAPAVAPSTPAIAPADEALSAEVIDFDLDLPVGDEETEPFKVVDGGKPLDFDFDLELPQQQPLHAATSPTTTSATPTTAELAPVAASEAQQDLTVSAIAGDAEASAPSHGGQGGQDEQASVLDETTRQEVDTKLELAQAYEEMGDSEGARELLQEVLEEGDQVQRDAARNKLALLV